MAWNCILKDRAIENVREDRRSAKNVEKYSISGQAVYFEGKYLPASEIRSIRVQPSVYNPNCCCGRGIPVFKIRLDYGGEKPVVLMIEREANVEKAVSMIRAANPALYDKVCDRTTFSPAGRGWGDVCDLQGTIVFLSSPASDYINGDVIVVDGGFKATMA